MSEVSWFDQDIAEVSTNKKDSKPEKNWPFAMDYDEEVKICILNDDDERIPPVHYHPVFHDNKVKRVLCIAADHLNDGDGCPLCDYTAAQPEGVRWKTELKQHYAYTVLVDRYDEEKGIRKCLRLCTPTEHRNIQRLRETAINKMGKDGLKNLWIEVTRDSSEDKAAKIGKLGQLLNDLDISEHDDDYLKPFSEAEILEQFVHEKSEREEIYADFKVDTKGSVEIREV